MCCSNRLRCRHLTAGLSGRRYFVSRQGGGGCFVFLRGLVLHKRASNQSYIWVGQWPVGYSASGRCLNHY